MKYPCLTNKAKNELANLLFGLLLITMLATISIAFIGMLVFFGVTLKDDTMNFTLISLYFFYLYLGIGTYYLIKWLKKSIIVCVG